jgi:hypothetical protein
MEYYPLVKRWQKIKPHLSDETVQNILVRDFNKYTIGRWGRPFDKGMLPRYFETCDWDLFRRGRRPEFWNYVKHAACHWLVNFNLELAIRVEPEKEWRILASDKHSTVWDGKDTLFDFNFTALQVDPNEAFELANKKELKPKQRLRVYCNYSI